MQNTINQINELVRKNEEVAISLKYHCFWASKAQSIRKFPVAIQKFDKNTDFFQLLNALTCSGLRIEKVTDWDPTLIHVYAA